MTTLNLDQLQESPYQGRLIREETKRGKTDDLALKTLINSIKTEGLLTPIIVRKVDAGYEIIDGHRRVEACRRLGQTEIETVVKELDDRKAQAFSIIGNLHRQNLSTIEKAIAFKKILSTGAFKDVKQFAKAIGKHETYVGDVLNTLEMDQRIINDLADNKTTADVRMLRAIRKVERAKNKVSDRQWGLYNRVIAEGLRRNDVIKLVKQELSETPRPTFNIQRKGKTINIGLSGVPADKIDEIQKMVEDYLNQVSLD